MKMAVRIKNLGIKFIRILLTALYDLFIKTKSKAVSPIYIATVSQPFQLFGIQP
jgi:hypothetical protein